MSASKKPKLELCPRVLVVEGVSDLLFLAEFLEDIGEKDVFIQKGDGKEHMETNLETFLKPPLLAAKTHIGVIVDADNNGPATAIRFAQILSGITKQEVREGEWTSGKPSLGLLVVPSPKEIGELEDVIWNAWKAAPANAASVACVEAFEADMASKADKKAHSPVKGRLGALLSIIHDDDPRIGPAAQANTFDFKHLGYDRLRKFLKFGKSD